jgi:tetrahydromethanopterin S-methyltransferase subunit C
MATLRRLASGLLSKGVISAGWYSILTGLVLLVVGLALASVSADDPAAGVVSVVSFLGGVWQLERGLRSEFPPRLRARNDKL